MALISSQEVKKIARISCIEIHDQELDDITRELEAVLAYAARVQEISQQPHVQECLVNVVRDDVTSPTDPEPIRSQAPLREGNFFVVPLILDTTE